MHQAIIHLHASFWIEAQGNASSDNPSSYNLWIKAQGHASTDDPIACVALDRGARHCTK